MEGLNRLSPDATELQPCIGDLTGAITRHGGDFVTWRRLSVTTASAFRRRLQVREKMNSCVQSKSMLRLPRVVWNLTLT